MEQAEYKKTRKELFKALLGVEKFFLKSPQMEKPKAAESKPGVIKRSAIWGLALLLFLVFGCGADLASERKEKAGAREKWKANIEQSIRQEAVRKLSGSDCKEKAQCLQQVTDSLKDFESVEAAAKEIATAPKKQENSTAGAAKCDSILPDGLVGRFWFVLLMICWIVEGFAALVMLEGVLRLAVWCGWRSKVLEKDKWETFSDKLLDRIADAAKEGSSAAAWLPLMAAVTAAGSVVYISVPPVSTRITLEPPGGTIPLTVSMVPATSTLAVSFVQASGPVKVEFVPSRKVQIALDPPTLQVSLSGGQTNGASNPLEALANAVSKVNDTSQNLTASMSGLEGAVMKLDVATQANARMIMTPNMFSPATCKYFFWLMQHTTDIDQDRRLSELFNKDLSWFYPALDNDLSRRNLMTQVCLGIYHPPLMPSPNPISGVRSVPEVANK